MNVDRGEHAWDPSEIDRPSTEPAGGTLDRAAGGDLSALAELYEQYAPFTYRLAYRITGSIADAQDVVQDLFIALPEALASYRGEGSFNAWFHSCAARQALLHLRARDRRQEVALRTDWRGRSERGLQERLELESALARLPQILRVVIVLKEIGGFSHQNIADMVGISEATSRMRLMRAREKLRGLLGPDGGR